MQWGGRVPSSLQPPQLYPLQDMDDATLCRLELEHRIELLMDEIGFLKKLHEEVVGRTQGGGGRGGGAHRGCGVTAYCGHIGAVGAGGESSEPTGAGRGTNGAAAAGPDSCTA